MTATDNASGPESSFGGSFEVTQRGNLEVRRAESFDQSLVLSHPDPSRRVISQPSTAGWEGRITSQAICHNP